MHFACRVLRLAAANVQRRWSRALAKKPRCSASVAHSAVSAMAAFIAGSTMRATGTSGGSVGSASSRSTPAHSDWIRRSFGSPSRLCGGGFATTATDTDAGAACAASRSTQSTSGNAAPNARRQACSSPASNSPHNRMFMGAQTSAGRMPRMIPPFGRIGLLGHAASAAAAAFSLWAGAAHAQTLTLHYMERAPYSVTAADGRVGGLTATPAALALAQARVPFVWKRTPGQRQLALIQEGSGLHCGVGWFRNAERRAHGKFSKALYRDQPFGVLARGDSGLRAGMRATDAMALPGETLLAKEGYSYGPVLDPLLAQRRAPTLHTSAETGQMVRMLLAGRASWMIVTPEEAQALLDEAAAPAHALRVAALADMPPGETRHLYCNHAVPDAWLAAIDLALPTVRR